MHPDDQDKADADMLHAQAIVRDETADKLCAAFVPGRGGVKADMPTICNAVDALMADCTPDPMALVDAAHGRPAALIKWLCQAIPLGAELAALKVDPLHVDSILRRAEVAV